MDLKSFLAISADSPRKSHLNLRPIKSRDTTKTLTAGTPQWPRSLDRKYPAIKMTNNGAGQLGWTRNVRPPTLPTNHRCRETANRKCHGRCFRPRLHFNMKLSLPEGSSGECPPNILIHKPPIVGRKVGKSTEL